MSGLLFEWVVASWAARQAQPWLERKRKEGLEKWAAQIWPNKEGERK